MDGTQPIQPYKFGKRSVWMIVGGVNLASLVIATKLVISLHPEDRISIKRGSALLLMGFTYFTSLNELLNNALMGTNLGNRFRQQYRLSYAEVLDINNKVVSAVQALLSCLTGVIVVTYSCSRDFMMTSHYMSEAYAWFGAAYFFYDIWSMYTVHLEMNAVEYSKARIQKKIKSDLSLSAGDGPPRPPPLLHYCRREPVILLHHLFVGGFGFLVIVYFRGNFGDCTFGFVYLMELSTPFVSLRGILSRLRLKSSRMYVVNGLAMLLTFFVCRVVSLPYVCLMYARVLRKSYTEAIQTLPLGCKISICILLLPQLYWFYLMCSGAIKMLLSRSPPLSGGDARDKRS